jgi:hypothetical protein
MHVDMLKQLFPSLPKYGSRFFRAAVGGFKLPVRQVSVQPDDRLTVGAHRTVIFRPKSFSLKTLCSGPKAIAFRLVHFHSPEVLAASLCGCLARIVSHASRVVRVARSAVRT